MSNGKHAVAEGGAMLATIIESGINATKEALPPPGPGVCSDHAPLVRAIEGTRVGVHALLICKQADLSSTGSLSAGLSSGSSQQNWVNLGKLGKAGGIPAIIVAICFGLSLLLGSVVYLKIQATKIISSNSVLADRLKAIGVGVNKNEEKKFEQIAALIETIRDAKE